MEKEGIGEGIYFESDGERRGGVYYSRAHWGRKEGGRGGGGGRIRLPFGNQHLNYPGAQ